MSKLVRYVQLKPSPAHVMANLPWTGRKRPYLLIIYSDNTTKTITVRNVNLREDPKLALHIAEKLKRQIEIEAAEYRFDLKRYSLKNETMPVDKFMSEYLQVLRRQADSGNISPGTVNTYTSYINTFLEYAGKISLSQVDVEFIEKYIDYIVASKTYRSTVFSNNTINTKLSILKAAFTYAQKKQYITANPFKLVPLLKSKQPLKYMNDREAEIMREGFAESNRIWATDLFDVGIATGLRISELLNMKFEHCQQIDIGKEKQHFYTIIGKGDKTRYVPVDNCLHILEKRRRISADKKHIIEHIADARHIFIDDCLQKANEGKVFFEITNQSTVNQLFAEVRRLKKLSDKITPHSMRHTFAVRFLEDDGDVYVLSQILGHSDLATTQIYLTVTPKLLRLRRKI